MSIYAGSSVQEVSSLSLHEDLSASEDAIRAELTESLLAEPAAISPKYLYDTLGSKLFEAICLLPEYYPTRTEAAIFSAYIPQIAQTVGQCATLIDLGAGNCAKAARLFPALRPKHYVAIDISADFLQVALSTLRQRFPTIKMTSLGLDFSSNLDLPKTLPQEKRVFFYPGSSIGNFPPAQAQAFLRRIRAACGPDGAILLGVDLIKEAPILNAAYDDASGVTAAFNLNVLNNLNKLLGTDFNAREWAHKAFFNPSQNRIEMHLQARQAVTVKWPGGCRQFAQGQRIHTESSYKYTQQSFCDLLKHAGFGDIETWTDPNEWFAVIHARAV